jgi:hypothetical protein
MQARKVCFFALCCSLTIKYILALASVNFIRHSFMRRRIYPTPFGEWDATNYILGNLFSSYIPLIISRVYTEIVNLASKPSQKLYESLILAQDERWRRV